LIFHRKKPCISKFGFVALVLVGQQARPQSIIQYCECELIYIVPSMIQLQRT